MFLAVVFFIPPFISGLHSCLITHAPIIFQLMKQGKLFIGYYDCYYQSLQLVPPQVYVFPREQTVPEGSATTISCKATEGTPKPTLTWKFEDGDLPLVANVISTQEGSLLHLSKTTKGMEGIYKCTATNKADNATSYATIHVLGSNIVFC